MISKVVSFDVFDTALERSVYEPTDIFKLVEKKVGKNFYAKRIEAERKAREKNPFYNLDDIYKFLPEFKKEDEINEELECCILNEDIFKIYNETKEEKIFISDMYLPSIVISQMLKKVGYKNPEVFVSCEHKANKGTGDLFKKACNIKKCKIVKHYGDNYLSDIEGAKKAGIPEVEFNVALHNKTLNIPAVRDPRLKKCFALAADKLEAKDKMALYVAPLVSEFTKWVLSKRKKGQKIFFCSRDMMVPYRLATEVLNEPDVYYIPTKAIVANPYVEQSARKTYTRDVDCVLMVNDTYAQGLLPLLKKYCSMLVENVITMNIAGIMSRATIILSAADDKTKASAELFIKHLLDGKLDVIGETPFMVANQDKSLSINE